MGQLKGPNPPWGHAERSARLPSVFLSKGDAPEVHLTPCLTRQGADKPRPEF